MSYDSLYIARVAPASEDWREAMQRGVEVFDRGKLWRESFSTSAFIASEKPATVLLDHEEGQVVGQVCGRTTALNGWHYLTFVLDRSKNLSCVAADRITVGCPISIGFRSFAHDKLLAESNVKQHTVAKLDEVSILRANDIPSYPGAQITQILEAPAKRSTALTPAPVKVIRRSTRTEDKEVAELHRRLDFYGDTAPLEVVLESMKREFEAVRRRRL